MHLEAAPHQVAPQGAGDGRQQHVVDGGPHGLAAVLDVLHLDRARPGRALAHAQRALEGRGRVAGPHQHLEQHLGSLGGALGQLQQVRGVAHDLHGLLHEGADLARDAHGAGDRAHRAGHGAGHRVEGPAEGPAQAAADLVGPPPAARLGRQRRRVGDQVGHGQQHVHQRHAVADAVVQAQQHGAALVDALDQVALPERLAEVERRAHQVADHVAQLGRSARLGQRQAVDVGGDVEGAVGHPVGLRALLAHAVAQAREAVGHARLQRVAQQLEGQGPVEPEDPRHHHEVGGVLHVQPGVVDVAERRPVPGAVRHVREGMVAPRARTGAAGYDTAGTCAHGRALAD